MSYKFQVLFRSAFVATAFLVSQAGLACDLADGSSAGRKPCREHSGKTQDLSMDKLRSPKWSNSLRGFGSLNLTRGHDAKAQAQSPQWGPLRLDSKQGVLAPPSFTGSVSRVASNPVF
jgi:hypothetical protein